MIRISDLVVQNLADAASSSDGLKIAIVSALAIVAAASIPAFISRTQKEPPSVKELRESQSALIIELQEDRDECKRTLEQTVTGMQLRTKEIDRLEKMLWHLGIDPETGQRKGRNQSERRN